MSRASELIDGRKGLAWVRQVQGFEEDVVVGVMLSQLAEPLARELATDHRKLAHI